MHVPPLVPVIVFPETEAPAQVLEEYVSVEGMVEDQLVELDPLGKL